MLNTICEGTADYWRTLTLSMPSRFAKKVTVLSRTSGPRFRVSCWCDIAGLDAVTNVGGAEVNVLSELDAMRT